MSDYSLFSFVLHAVPPLHKMTAGEKEEHGEPDGTLWCIPEQPDSPRSLCAEIQGHCNNQPSTAQHLTIHAPLSSINRFSDVL
jgi:hypothetical protein